MLDTLGKQPYSLQLSLYIYRLVADSDTRLDHNYGVRIPPQLHLAVGMFTYVHTWNQTCWIVYLLCCRLILCARAPYSTFSSACARSHQHGGSGEELIHTLTSWTLLLSVVWKSASIASTLLAGTPRYRPSWYIGGLLL